jgi:hypothetical protein
MDAPSKPVVDHTRRGWAEAPRTKQLTAAEWRRLRSALNDVDQKLHQLSQAEHEERRR